ncbi:hypothetical protein OSS47_21035 [Pseudomonas citronellolis]|nr:PSPA7_2676 family Cys-rich small protein [Pseudomonas citronellolis]WAB90606.1 hypothetical protein OSS47_21035 [Pseudomonas citronellolis]
MKSALLCLLRGCEWEGREVLEVGRGRLLHQCCRRCGAHRYAAAAELP